MNSATTELTVANTILDQLGGGRFLAMTGAKNLLGDKDSLQFKLPARFAKSGINCVRVAINAMDTYDVEFYKIGRRSFDAERVEAIFGVYGEDLRRVFRETTGLEVSL
jgi:hypothetical protein